MAGSFIGGLPTGLVEQLLAAGNRLEVPPGTGTGEYPRAMLVVRGWCGCT
jgi:hypothetical protein